MNEGRARLQFFRPDRVSSAIVDIVIALRYMPNPRVPSRGELDKTFEILNNSVNDPVVFNCIVNAAKSMGFSGMLEIFDESSEDLNMRGYSPR